MKKFAFAVCLERFRLSEIANVIEDDFSARHWFAGAIDDPSAKGARRSTRLRERIADE